MHDGTAVHGLGKGAHARRAAGMVAIRARGAHGKYDHVRRSTGGCGLSHQVHRQHYLAGFLDNGVWLVLDVVECALPPWARERSGRRAMLQARAHSRVVPCAVVKSDIYISCRFIVAWLRVWASVFHSSQLGMTCDALYAHIVSRSLSLICNVCIERIHKICKLRWRFLHWSP